MLLPPVAVSAATVSPSRATATVLPLYASSDPGAQYKVPEPDT